MFAGFVKKLKKIWEELNWVPPTFNELRENYPHAEGCDSQAFITSQETDYEYAGADAWVGPNLVKVTKYYLECTKCKVKKQYYG